MPTWYETDAELDAAVADVAALTPAARKVLSDVIEHQGLRVTKVSATAERLEGLGFVFVREDGAYSTEATLTPSLWGEEALDAFETRSERARKPRGARLPAPRNRAEGQSRTVPD